MKVWLRLHVPLLLLPLLVLPPPHPRGSAPPGSPQLLSGPFLQRLGSLLHLSQPPCRVILLATAVFSNFFPNLSRFLIVSCHVNGTKAVQCH